MIAKTEGFAGGIVAEHASRWLSAIPLRHARRSFTGAAVPADDLEALASLAERWKPWPGARVVVLREAPASVFAGIVGSYGGVSGSPSALAFIGGADVNPAIVGYTGEALVLEATARGIDTCWVAGLFRSAAVQRLTPIEPGERVYAVSALGYSTAAATLKERVLFGAGRPKARRSLDEIAPDHDSWPAWAVAAVVAARIAPSAMNRQPWRFTLDGGALRVAYDGADALPTSKRLDCGIAMLHAELGAAGEGVGGSWELLTEPDVACFVPGEG